MIRIETAERGGKTFEEIVLEIGDLAFRRQVTSERDVMLAHRLALKMQMDIVDLRRDRV